MDAAAVLVGDVPGDLGHGVAEPVARRDAVLLAAAEDRRCEHAVARGGETTLPLSSASLQRARSSTVDISEPAA